MQPSHLEYVVMDTHSVHYSIKIDPFRRINIPHQTIQCGITRCIIEMSMGSFSLPLVVQGWEASLHHCLKKCHRPHQTDHPLLVLDLGKRKKSMQHLVSILYFFLTRPQVTFKVSQQIVQWLCYTKLFSSCQYNSISQYQILCSTVPQYLCVKGNC